MKINVIGLGYIGLPTALMLAANGNQVIGTDKNLSLINTLQKGDITFEEDGLKKLLEKAIDGGIIFSHNYEKADVYIVTVPTPYDKKTKKVDASYVISAVREIIDVAETDSIIVIESTISPGTMDKYIRTLVENNDKVFHLIHAPERIIPGNMIYELENNNRTIGADDVKIGNIVKSIYKTFCKGQITVTSIKIAEMTKVVENTYRDVNIAFANELAQICRSDEIDVYEVIKIANMHPRVNILTPGPGVGGHCISVDPWFLVGDYPELTNIISTARKVNNSMPEFVLERIAQIMEENEIKEVSRVGLYGLTYKENVDDIRESPTLQLLECMRKHLASGIKCFDPFIHENIVDNQYQNFQQFLEDIDLLVIMVGHTHIIDNLYQVKDKILFDTRNVCKFENIYRL